MPLVLELPLKVAGEVLTNQEGHSAKSRPDRSTLGMGHRVIPGLLSEIAELNCLAF